MISLSGGQLLAGLLAAGGFAALGRIWCFSYYQLVISFFGIVPLIMEFIHLIAEFALSIDDSSSWPLAKQFVLNININKNTKSQSYWLGASIQVWHKPSNPKIIQYSIVLFYSGYLFTVLLILSK
jgi:hypothetical protein